METNNIYTTPKIEIIEISTEGVMAQSDPYINDTDKVTSTSGRAKKRSLWED